MRVSIVVPTWNGAELLARHLASVRDEAAEVAGGAEVVVVDDGSDSGGSEVARIVREVGAPARVIRRERNGGFAAATNEGAAGALGQHVFFFNDDMRPEPGCLAALLAALEARAELFAVTPLVLNLAEGFTESTTAVRFHRGVFDAVLPGRSGAAPLAAGELRRIAFPCGGALLCRRDELLALGGFSPLFAPFYWEDVDLGWRARRAGREIAECGDARVLHEHARTIGRLPPSRVRRVYERNRLLFTWLHLAGAGAWVRHLLWLLPRTLAALARNDAAAAALPLALVRIAAVAAARRRMRPTRSHAAALLREVVARGDAGWPSALPSA
jgi:GT2 family glycosyltransferase